MDEFNKKIQDRIERLNKSKRIRDLVENKYYMFGVFCPDDCVVKTIVLEKIDGKWVRIPIFLWDNNEI